MKQMRAKTFVVLMGCAFVAALGVLAGSVKTAQMWWGKEHDWKSGFINASSHFSNREEKANYISQPNLPYTGFIIGGSKSGALQPELFNAYTAEHFYNFYVGNGNFRDYDLYCDYLISAYGEKLKKILLHLSSHESEAYIRTQSDFIPAVMVSSSFEKIKSYGRYIKMYYLNAQVFLDLYKNHANKDTALGITTQYGARNRLEDAVMQTIYNNDSSEFQKGVFSYWEKYEDAIHDLFYRQTNLPACDQNIAALRRIKSRCDEHGVQFSVVIGPTFIAELYKYASPQYVQYLKDIVSVCGNVWNFSGINDVNLNPYNFYNGGHCWIFVGDKMIETMYSPEPNTRDMDSFGILLNESNIDAYIQSQRQKWLALKAEYDATGTIALPGMADASYLGE